MRIRIGVLFNIFTKMFLPLSELSHALLEDEPKPGFLATFFPFACLEAIITAAAVITT